MGIQRTYSLVDTTPDDLGDLASPDQSEATIEIGFEAKRYHSKSGRRNYIFDIYNVVSRLITPEELKISDDEWFDIQCEYNYSDDDSLNDDVDSDLQELDDDDEDIKPLASTAIQELLAEDEAECEQFARVDLRYDSEDHQIRLSNQRGYTIDGQSYGIRETHPLYFLGNQPYSDTEILNSPASVLENLFDFYDIINPLNSELMRSGNIMPEKDKIQEIMFLVRCLRQKKIVIS
jgi:hypothetical protein